MLLIVAMAQPAAWACSLQFTSLARSRTVSTAQIGVSGTCSGNANAGDPSKVAAFIYDTLFFSQSGNFTKLINFLRSGASTVTLQKGANTLTVTGRVSGYYASDSSPLPLKLKRALVPTV